MSGIQYPKAPVDIESINGNPVSMGQGNSDAGSPRVVIASDQPAIPVTSAPNFATRSDTFVAIGNGTVVNKTVAPVTKFAVQVKGSGAAPTAWEVVLETSLDGVNFTTVLDHLTNVGDGKMVYTGHLDSPSLYFRSRVVSLTLGSATDIVVTILGMN